MRRLIAIAIAMLMLLAGIGTTLILSQRQQRASPSSTDELRESTAGSSPGDAGVANIRRLQRSRPPSPKTLLPPYRRLWSVYGDSSFIEFLRSSSVSSSSSRPTGARSGGLYAQRAPPLAAASRTLRGRLARSRRNEGGVRGDGPPALRSRTGRGRRRRPE